MALKLVSLWELIQGVTLGREYTLCIYQWARRQTWRSMFNQIKSRSIINEFDFKGRHKISFLIPLGRESKTTFQDVGQLEKNYLCSSTGSSTPLHNTCFNQVRPSPESLRNLFSFYSFCNRIVIECSQHILISDETADTYFHIYVFSAKLTL